ncbi:MAG: MaoC family dehydratase [Rhodospirillales bacterium]|nr:MaoC family dehydratase [Rhodospirillales bacterium]
MATLELNNIDELKAYVGKDLGTSDWVLVDQEMIDKFADATGDHQWIHVDVEKAKKFMPGGSTIAHGYLTLSLAPMMMYEIYQVKSVKTGINYGANKIRFLNMVPAGSRLRMQLKLLSLEQGKDGGYQMITEITIEMEGQERPALFAEMIAVLYE